MAHALINLLIVMIFITPTLFLLYYQVLPLALIGLTVAYAGCIRYAVHVDSASNDLIIEHENKTLVMQDFFTDLKKEVHSQPTRFSTWICSDSLKKAIKIAKIQI